MQHANATVRLGSAVVAVALVLSAGAFAADQPAEEKSSYGEYWEKILALYEQARESGEQVPADVTAWVQQDFQKIGTWEYLVVTVEADTAKLAEELNRLGEERWECIWVEGDGSSRRLIFKRRERSWLGSVRWMDMLKMIRGEGDAGGE